MKITWPVFFLFLVLSVFGGCAPLTAPEDSPSSLTTTVAEPLLEETDFECSYFYFLWGRYAELNAHFTEALEAYEKAFICDPKAEYISRKIPLILLRLGRSGEAREHLQGYLQKYPEETGARMLLAKIYIRQKAYEEAARQYQIIHQQHPDETQSLLLLSELYLLRQQFDAAVDVLQQVLNLSSETYPAHVLLARIYVRQKQVVKALDHYKKALALNWSSELESELGEVYLQEKEYAKAEALYRHIVTRESNNEEAGISLVHVYLLQKKEEAALRELNRVKSIADNPERVDLTLARIYGRRKEYAKAVDILQGVLAKDNLPEARYLLGILFFQLKQYEDAIEQLQQVSRETEEYDDSIMLQVRLLRVLKRPDDAVAVLEKTLQDKEMHSVDMYILLATLYLEQGKREQGEDVFHRALVLYPKNENLLYEFGLFFDQAGLQERAMALMQQVLALYPENAAALNYVGYTWADSRKNLDKALEYIKRAVALKPENGYVRDSLGWVYYQLGDLEAAQKELEVALQLSGDDPAIFDHFGDVYLALGQLEKALLSYRKAWEQFTEEQDKTRVQKKIQGLEKQTTP